MQNSEYTNYFFSVIHLNVPELSNVTYIRGLQILWHQLNSYGMRGLALDWLSSYFLHRKQWVRTVSSYSELQGVLEGSVLGPVLSISIFLNDLLLNFFQWVTGSNKKSLRISISLSSVYCLFEVLIYYFADLKSYFTALQTTQYFSMPQNILKIWTLLWNKIWNI